MIRLDKLLAHSGFGSRKDVSKLIRQKKVMVNETIVTKAGFIVDEKADLVYVDEMLVDYQEYYYLMMNKPSGYVCANEDNIYPTIFSLLLEYEDINLFSVGRLDVDTTGLILITNDGNFNHNIISPKKDIIKIYHAKVDGFIEQKDIEYFKEGVIIKSDTQCKPASLKIIEEQANYSILEVGISEGKFHQVKLMFKAIGLNVLELKRIKIANLELDKSLELGEYRSLSNTEIHKLINIVPEEDDS